MPPGARRSRAGRDRAGSVVPVGRGQTPVVVAKYTGDALWGLVVFLGIAFLLSRRSTCVVAALATTFAWAVEVSQLFHTPWLDAIRGTRLGGLVLGTPASTFAWADIVAYLLGIAVGAATEQGLGKMPDRHNASG